MCFAAHGQPTGALRLAEPLLRRTLKRQFAGHCAKLKQVLEDSTMRLAAATVYRRCASTTWSTRKRER